MQLSTDIKVMVTIVIGTKKTKLHELRTNSTGLSCDSVEPVKALTNILKARRGPPIRSLNKSVLAILLEKIWNEVLAKFIIQVVARINPFFTAATTAAAEISNVLLVE